MTSESTATLQSAYGELVEAEWFRPYNSLLGADAQASA